MYPSGNPMMVFKSLLDEIYIKGAYTSFSHHKEPLKISLMHCELNMIFETRVIAETFQCILKYYHVIEEILRK